MTTIRPALAEADFYIVTVPTPIDARAGRISAPCWRPPQTVGGALKRGDIVVYESTVYPGAIEEECMPVLEKASGLAARPRFHGRLFARTDQSWRQDASLRDRSSKSCRRRIARTLDIVADVYGSVVKAGIHRAPSIKVAEAAKVIENTQRDLNIAFMNELSAIFHQLGIDTGDVLAAASTKWNFPDFSARPRRWALHRRRPVLSDLPGRKGGLSSGNHPRRPAHQRRHGSSALRASACARCCSAAAPIRLVTILGMTFKENVPDIRNSKVIDIARELERVGVGVQVHDPLASAEEARARIWHYA